MSVHRIYKNETNSALIDKADYAYRIGAAKSCMDNSGRKYIEFSDEDIWNEEKEIEHFCNTDSLFQVAKLEFTLGVIFSLIKKKGLTRTLLRKLIMGGEQ